MLFNSAGHWINTEYTGQFLLSGVDRINTEYTGLFLLSGVDWINTEFTGLFLLSGVDFLHASSGSWAALLSSAGAGPPLGQRKSTA